MKEFFKQHQFYCWPSRQGLCISFYVWVPCWSQGNNSSLCRLSDYLQSFASALYFSHILPLLWSPNKILPHGILRFSNGSHLNPSNCLRSRFDYVLLPVKPSAFSYIAVVFIWIPVHEVSYLWILLMYFGESITCNWLSVHFLVLFFSLRRRRCWKRWQKALRI